MIYMNDLPRTRICVHLEKAIDGDGCRCNEKH